MSAHELVQYLSWSVYVLIFVLTLIKAVQRPSRANIDILLFFTASTLVIAISVGTRLQLIPGGRITGAISLSALVMLAYLLLRLVDDFSDVPRWLMRLAEVGLVVLVGAAFALDVPRPLELTLAAIVYLVGFLLYTVVAFIRESRKSSGVTRRRMRAVAWGSIWLALVLVFAVLQLILPQYRELWISLVDVAGLASGLSYFVGFATPGLIRRAWQEPDLRAFLGRAASLPRLPDTTSIVREMERGAAASVGGPQASIGLWDEDAQVLRFVLPGGQVNIPKTMESVAGRVLITQQPVFAGNMQRDVGPTYARLAKIHGANAMLAAPITAGGKQLGVLTVHATHAPIFADEDLALVQLLADQAAVILESRALIDEAARVKAREEVARMKEDFLSAAAHDLKTPLTTIVAQAQLLEKRALKNPTEPPDVTSLHKLVKEAQRLKTLVLELLDAARTEQGKLVGEREILDLTALAQETCSRHGTERHPCVVEADGPVQGTYDTIRILQLLENLVENAVKYSPEGGVVRIRVWNDGTSNRISVSDNGIGIPSTDLPHIFERFHRGTNVDDRRFAGMGLGLYICRGIAEQHGGSIWAESEPGSGSTFHVTLPAEVASDVDIPDSKEMEVGQQVTYA